MDKAIKEKWLEALRSGKYEQCTGQLVEEKIKWPDEGPTGQFCYCCLGVLGEITQKDFIKNVDELSLDNGGGLLCYDIAEPMGLKGDIQSKLAEMNDDGKSFDQIADWIEENL